MTTDPIYRLRRALFHRDAPSEERQSVCLSLHAALLGRPEITRIYLTDPSLAALPVLFYSDVRGTRRTTSIDIQRLGFDSFAAIDRLTSMDRLVARGLCEECLHLGWGDGHVHYEMARVTPFTSEDLSVYLWPGESWRGIQTASLPPPLRPLLIRRRDRVATAATEASFCDVSDSPGQSISEFDTVYRQHIETEWRKRWGSPDRYRVNTPEQDIVRAVLTDSSWGRRG